MHHAPLPKPPLSLVSRRKEIRPFEQRTQWVVMETGPRGHLKTHLWSGGGEGWGVEGGEKNKTCHLTKAPAEPGAARAALFHQPDGKQ